MATSERDFTRTKRNGSAGSNTKLTESLAVEACRLYFDKRKTQQAVGNYLGLSTTSVGNCIRLARLIAADEYDLIYRMISDQSARYEIVCAIAEFVGKPFPPPSEPALLTTIDESKEPDPPENEGVYLLKVLESLEALTKQNEKILDAISYLAADLKDNKNVNCDLIAAELRSIKSFVETIKNNTRRKGL